MTEIPTLQNGEQYASAWRTGYEAGWQAAQTVLADAARRDKTRADQIASTCIPKRPGGSRCASSADKDLAIAIYRRLDGLQWAVEYLRSRRPTPEGPGHG